MKHKLRSDKIIVSLTSIKRTTPELMGNKWKKYIYLIYENFEKHRDINFYWSLWVFPRHVAFAQITFQTGEDTICSICSNSLSFNKHHCVIWEIFNRHASMADGTCLLDSAPSGAKSHSDPAMESSSCFPKLLTIYLTFCITQNFCSELHFRLLCGVNCELFTCTWIHVSEFCGEKL